MIKAFDFFGIEIHFVRLFQSTLLDQNPPFRLDMLTAFFEWLQLLLIVLPLFTLAMRYLTYPILDFYTAKLNVSALTNSVQALVSPLLLCPLFYAATWDVFILAMLTLLINLSCVWRQLDGEDIIREERK